MGAVRFAEREGSRDRGVSDLDGEVWVRNVETCDDVQISRFVNLGHGGLRLKGERGWMDSHHRLSTP